jgi:hypothetical protein
VTNLQCSNQQANEELLPVPASSVSFGPDSAWRECLRADIRAGLAAGRWGWRQSIAPALERDYGIDKDDRVRISRELVDSLIAEAHNLGEWSVEWTEARLSSTRATYPRAATKSFTARGELLPQARLTDAKVRSIRARYAQRRRHKVTIKQLAVEHDVKPITIMRVLHRKTWSHVK